VLTADLVQARRRGGELLLVAMDAERRSRAGAIASVLLEVVRAHVGATREEIDLALDGIEVAPHEQRMKAGLRKLLSDACDVEAHVELDPATLRADLFARAAAARRASETREGFDREALVADVAAAQGVGPEELERALFADLRGAHVLRAAPPLSPAFLVDAYERGQAQAVLLRAVKVTVDVEAASAGATRALFRRLKFLRLLHTVARSEEGYRVVIDGPFSLFESVTKYGLELAMLLPMLDGCDAWSLVAEIRWGKAREPLVFRLKGGAVGHASSPPPLPDEVRALVASFGRLASPWRVRASTAILELAGIGLCVPDLVFERDGARVYLEVMGYWSRDAVWKRVELVEKGLAEPIVFAVSARLRVSEEVLDAASGAALYVYKGTMSARSVAECVERLAKARSGG
jgi:predicted nuclease of restriction endonuclease-like RecB superfamily